MPPPYEVVGMVEKHLGFGFPEIQLIRPTAELTFGLMFHFVSGNKIKNFFILLKRLTTE